MSIFELVNEIDDEDIVLPAIQRDFVWDEDRIELLLDSMFRGYPVGIVLLWETYQQIQFRPFGRHHVPGGIYQFEENKKIDGSSWCLTASSALARFTSR